eukprot:TRINITY_DN7304_c0_g1_i1.p1 TRINITY_DN7304_c0_g1~~TRINITY_DN7304_c0_g1_i1.p1  ORF type:complete len:321 (+),score=53.12 TRINITY_DN7304_c0_g1_i1:286-1248(+)
MRRKGIHSGEQDWGGLHWPVQKQRQKGRCQTRAFSLTLRKTLLQAKESSYTKPKSTNSSSAAVTIVLGIPYVFYSGTEGNLNVLVMELLGDNLEELMQCYGGKVPLQAVQVIATQCLRRIRKVHKNLLIHRDIKPENIAIGLEKRATTPYLFDFGLAHQYQDLKAGAHIPFRKNKHLIGSIRYSSLNTHLGFEQSRRDDLESLGFVFVYLAKGKLPWQGLASKDLNERFRKVREVMASTGVDALTKDLPVIGEYKEYARYVRKFKFTEEPNYEYLQELFEKKVVLEDNEEGTVFDWTDLNVKTISQSRTCLLYTSDAADE